MAAVELLDANAGLLQPGDAALIERMLRTARTWALVDGLASNVMGTLTERHPELTADLDRWAGDDDFWLRRSAMLALLVPLRRGEGDFGRFTRYADQMLEEKEFFIRKAIGSILRDTAKRRPEMVAAWLEPRAHRASGVTMREAVKPLPPEVAARLLAARPGQRGRGQSRQPRCSPWSDAPGRRSRPRRRWLARSPAPPALDPGNEAPEPAAPGQHPRPVADRRLAPAAQLPLADPELPGDQLRPCARPAEQPGRLEHQPVRRPLGHHLGGDRRHPAHGLARAAATRAAGPGAARAGQRVHPLVEQLAERHAERAPPAPGRNRAPTNTLPGARNPGAGPVSGPATKAPTPLCQTRSVQASGSTGIGSPPPGGMTETHRQWISARNATPGANSRYPGASPPGHSFIRVSGSFKPVVRVV